MIPEKEINQRIASKLRRQGYLVKQEIYFNPVEIDIIVFGCCFTQVSEL